MHGGLHPHEWMKRNGYATWCIHQINEQRHIVTNLRVVIKEHHLDERQKEWREAEKKYWRWLEKHNRPTKL